MPSITSSSRSMGAPSVVRNPPTCWTPILRIGQHVLDLLSAPVEADPPYQRGSIDDQRMLVDERSHLIRQAPRTGQPIPVPFHKVDLRLVGMAETVHGVDDGAEYRLGVGAGASEGHEDLAGGRQLLTGSSERPPRLSCRCPFVGHEVSLARQSGAPPRRPLSAVSSCRPHLARAHKPMPAFCQHTLGAWGASCRREPAFSRPD